MVEKRVSPDRNLVVVVVPSLVSRLMLMSPSSILGRRSRRAWGGGFIREETIVSMNLSDVSILPTMVQDQVLLTDSQI